MSNIRHGSRIVTRLNITDVFAFAGIVMACLLFAISG
jgi:hypothetical protein